MLRGSISSICSINYPNLTLLDLSYNQFSGQLPKCWMSMPKLSILNLANNHLSGEVPQSLGPSDCLLLSLQLQSNKLFGELPSSLRNCKHLTMLDVGENQLTGNISPWIGTNLGMLKLLSLRDNEFYGTIPPEVCHLTQIQILDLSRNNISGRIPPCFNNFTFLVQQDITTPNMIPQTEFIVMRCENAFVYWKGQEKEYNKTLRLLKLIDLSNNRLVGNIPRQLSLLRGLISLNLSRNHLTGNIDSEIGQMNMLESLDLSRNQLSGEIPVGLAELSFLAVLDLSFNNLSGNIPSGTQLQGFNASVYAGNYGLCGPPLAACLAPDGLPSATDSKFDIGFYISTVLGYVLGFWGVIVTLVLNNSWKKLIFTFGTKSGTGFTGRPPP
ncbi:Receptor-like protein EIX2 [Sesamum alatum]|uniref:Receptor-like protein EIX2 n=1 Tax=Sesamum alatum TaxID=300844 RepID=A0AAE1YGQ4_9LAMI|nr:Receptor-like protein EIX2 [Sesamum alatum]